jgi:hypothetical protein
MPILLGSPPTLACPYCPRHFRSKGGRTQHILAKHHTDSEGREPHGSNPSLPSSPVPSSLPHEFYYEQTPSPIPFESTTPPPSPEEVNTANPDIDVDVEQPPFDLNSTPPDFYGEDLPHGEDATEQPDPPHPPHLMRSYHPKLDGELSAFRSILTLMMIICRENLRQERK